MTELDMSEIAVLRRASDHNWNRMRYVEKVIYRLMLTIDRLPDNTIIEGTDDVDIRDTVEYNEAAHVLGWDIDWAELAERRHSGL